MSATGPKEEQAPWIEKHRPQYLKDVHGQEEVVEYLNKVVEMGRERLPNLLFYGPPGSGKTTSALALCRELYGEGENFKGRVHELNASDERGLAAIREKVRDLSRQSVIDGYKVIILDEADSMTKAAQSSLLSLLEHNSEITRVIIICNYHTKLSENISSRCQMSCFRKITPEAQKERINAVCEKERLTLAEGAVEELTRLSDGDLRAAVMLLDATRHMVPDGEPITKEVILAQAGECDPAMVRTLLLNVAKTTEPREWRSELRAVLAEGWIALDLLRQMRAVASTLITDGELLRSALERFNQGEKSLIRNGGSGYVQLFACLGAFSQHYRLQQSPGAETGR